MKRNDEDFFQFEKKKNGIRLLKKVTITVFLYRIKHTSTTLKHLARVRQYYGRLVAFSVLTHQVPYLILP